MSPPNSYALCVVAYPQVDVVVRLLEAQGDEVLVVLPERYLQLVVPNSSRQQGVKVRHMLVEYCI